MLRCMSLSFSNRHSTITLLKNTMLKKITFTLLLTTLVSTPFIWNHFDWDLLSNNQLLALVILIMVLGDLYLFFSIKERGARKVITLIAYPLLQFCIMSIFGLMAFYKALG